MNLVNLTPHPINIYDESGTVLLLTVPVSDYVARVGSEFSASGEMEAGGVVVSIGSVVFNKHEMYQVLHKEAYGKDKIDNPSQYPLPDIEDGTMYIVSGMMLDLREDFVAPGYAVRNEKGHTIGCIGLSV